ncbi:hypothetical protein [Peterkaempfera bronchialis]
MSASGCTGNRGAPDGSGSVCFYVYGTKLHVDSVKVEKLSQYDWTDYAEVSIGDTWGLMGATRSGSRGQTVTESSAVGLSFANNTKACGWWHKFPGLKGCITIHS